MAVAKAHLNLQCCLLSGGASRRMGRDKALLPHPDGETWLVRTLRLLSELEAPITVLSRHEEHLLIAQHMGFTALAEPPPWEGPLLALQRLMEHHPNQRLLLCPVDMPELNLDALQSLLLAASSDPSAISVAHDGQRLQPLLGIYPSDSPRRRSLTDSLATGERRLQSWLTNASYTEVRLDPTVIRNCNRASEAPLALGDQGCTRLD